jgi:hypothetical protein
VKFELVCFGRNMTLQLCCVWNFICSIALFAALLCLQHCLFTALQFLVALHCSAAHAVQSECAAVQGKKPARTTCKT